MSGLAVGPDVSAPWWEALVPWTPFDVLVLVVLAYAAALYLLGVVTLAVAAPAEVAEFVDESAGFGAAGRVVAVGGVILLMVVLALLWPAVWVFERMRSEELLWTRWGGS